MLYRLPSSLYIFFILLYQLHDKRDKYKFKDESTSEIPRDGVSSDLGLDWELVNMLSKI